jgi:hypothetical protein
MDNQNFIPLFFYFELGGHLGWKSGSPDTILEGNQIWQGWSLGGSLSKLCPTAPPSIQDGQIKLQFILTYTKAAMDNQNFIPPFSYFELGGHLGWKSGSFSLYSGFFCEIFLSADIYRLCKLGIF